MLKIITGACVALMLSGCCGMYTNCSQPSNRGAGATCGCGCDCATYKSCGRCPKVTY